MNEIKDRFLRFVSRKYRKRKEVEEGAKYSKDIAEATLNAVAVENSKNINLINSYNVTLMSSIFENCPKNHVIFVRFANGNYDVKLPKDVLIKIIKAVLEPKTIIVKSGYVEYGVVCFNPDRYNRVSEFILAPRVANPTINRIYADGIPIIAFNYVPISKLSAIDFDNFDFKSTWCRQDD